MYLLIFRKADYEAFQKGRLVNPDASRSANGTAPISSYFQSTTKYKHSDPEQKAIRKAIPDLVVECSLPIHLVEKEAFRHLMQTANSKYINGNRFVCCLSSLIDRCLNFVLWL